MMISKEFTADLFSKAKKYEKHINIATNIAEAVQEVTEKPTFATFAKVILKTVKTVLEENRVWVEDFFDENWVRPFPNDFRQTIVNIVSKKPHKTIMPHDSGQKIHIAELDGERVAWLVSVGHNGEEFVEEVCVLKERQEQAQAAIKKYLWESIPYQFIVARCSKSSNRYGGNDVVFEKDDAINVYPTKKAEDIAAYIARCQTDKVARSIVFYGPPGTGKTTVTRRVSEILRYRTLRIRVEDVARFENSTIFEVLNIFQPDAVILDDFDRANNGQPLLELLEFLHRHVKLVMATANDINFSAMNITSNMADAILRPGRFDEEVKVANIEEDIVKTLLGEENLQYFEQVKTWPVAFIQEYLVRRKYKRQDELEESLKELKTRVERYLTVKKEPEDEENED